MDLVDLAVRAVDGTKVAANASVNRSYDAAGLRGLLERLERAIADLEAQNETGEDDAVTRLPKKLADKEVMREQVRQAMADLASQKRHRRINLTDPEARVMKGRHGTIVAGYNAQAMVSVTKTEEGTSGMLVTTVGVVDAANDNALLVPMMEQAEETTGAKSQMTLADAGYFAASHVAECDRRGQKVVVPEAPGSIPASGVSRLTPLFPGRPARRGSSWSTPRQAASHSAKPEYIPEALQPLQEALQQVHSAVSPLRCLGFSHRQLCGKNSSREAGYAPGRCHGGRSDFHYHPCRP